MEKPLERVVFSWYNKAMNSEKVSNTSENLEAPKNTIGKKLFSFFGKQEKENIPGDYYLLSEHLDKVHKKAWKDLIAHWDADDKPKLSAELGELMEHYIDSPNYRFGVHRSSNINGERPETDAVLNNIMQEGLVVLGDASSGSIRNNADPEKTVSFCKNILDAVIFTKSSRQGSTGAVLVAIPSEFVNEEGEIVPGKAENVYDYDKIGNAHIKPEYILGFAPNLGKGSTVGFISRQELLNK